MIELMKKSFAEKNASAERISLEEVLQTIIHNITYAG